LCKSKVIELPSYQQKAAPKKFIFQMANLFSMDNQHQVSSSIGISSTSSFLQGQNGQMSSPDVPPSESPVSAVVSPVPGPLNNVEVATDVALAKGTKRYVRDAAQGDRDARARSSSPSKRPKSNAAGLQAPVQDSAQVKSTSAKLAAPKIQEDTGAEPQTTDHAGSTVTPPDTHVMEDARANAATNFALMPMALSPHNSGPPGQATATPEEDANMQGIIERSALGSSPPSSPNSGPPERAITALDEDANTQGTAGQRSPYLRADDSGPNMPCFSPYDTVAEAQPQAVALGSHALSESADMDCDLPEAKASLHADEDAKSITIQSKNVSQSNEDSAWSDAFMESIQELFESTMPGEAVLRHSPVEPPGLAPLGDVSQEDLCMRLGVEPNLIHDVPLSAEREASIFGIVNDESSPINQTAEPASELALPVGADLTPQPLEHPVVPQESRPDAAQPAPLGLSEADLQAHLAPGPSGMHEGFGWDDLRPSEAESIARQFRIASELTDDESAPASPCDMSL